MAILPAGGQDSSASNREPVNSNLPVKQDSREISIQQADLNRQDSLEIMKAQKESSQTILQALKELTSIARMISKDVNKNTQLLSKIAAQKQALGGEGSILGGKVSGIEEFFSRMKEINEDRRVDEIEDREERKKASLDYSARQDKRDKEQAAKSLVQDVKRWLPQSGNLVSLSERLMDNVFTSIVTAFQKPKAKAGLTSGINFGGLAGNPLAAINPTVQKDQTQLTDFFKVPDRHPVGIFLKSLFHPGISTKGEQAESPAISGGLGPLFIIGLGLLLALFWKGVRTGIPTLVGNAIGFFSKAITAFGDGLKLSLGKGPKFIEAGIEGAFRPFKSLTNLGATVGKSFPKFAEFFTETLPKMGSVLGKIPGLSLVSKVLKFAGPLGTAVDFGIDFFKNGLGNFKKGKIGEGIVGTLFGEDLTKRKGGFTGKDVALDVLGQGLKGAGLGFLVGGPIGAAIGGGLFSLGALVKTGIKTHWFDKNLPMLRDRFTSIGNPVEGGLRALDDFKKGNVLGGVTSIILGITSPFTNLITGPLRGIVKSFPDFKKGNIALGIKDLFFGTFTFLQDIENVSKPVLSFLSGLKGPIMSGVSSVANFFRPVADLVRGFVNNPAESLNGLKSIFSGLGKLASGFNVGKIIQDGIAGVERFFSPLRSLFDWFTSAGNAVTGILQKIGIVKGTPINEVGSNLNTTVNNSGNLLDQIFSGFKIQNNVAAPEIPAMDLGISSYY